MGEKINKDVLVRQFKGDTALEVKHNKDRGRYFLASRDLQIGESVLREKAYAASVYHPITQFVCDVCWAYSPNSPLEEYGCSLCKQLYCCSSTCYATALEYHKPLECEMYQKFENSQVNDDNMLCAVKLVIRIFALRNLEIAKQADTQYYEQFCELLLHQAEEYPPKAAALFKNTVDYLMKLGSDTLFMGVNKEEVLAALLRYYSNSFGIWSAPEWIEGVDCIGTGIFLKSCLFNHSCSPNIKAVREQGTFVFMPTEDIKAGDELCICYVDPGLPTDKRRAELQSEFLFACTCKDCVASTSKPKKAQKRKRKRHY